MREIEHVRVGATIGTTNYTTIITDGNHTVYSDEPLHKNGQDKGLTPKQYLGGSLASCTAITLKMYADRKGWPINSILVEIDCTHLYDRESKLTSIVTVDADLTEAQVERMYIIAQKCPIHKVLARGAEITTRLKMAM